jgi:RecB family endonuclease NucS
MAGRTEIERLELGRLERLDLRSFWGEQLPDLTPWFLQNIDLLSETLGIDITPLEREVDIDMGGFHVLGSDSLGRPIVIDNRMETTTASSASSSSKRPGWRRRW